MNKFIQLIVLSHVAERVCESIPDAAITTKEKHVAKACQHVDYDYGDKEWVYFNAITIEVLGPYRLIVYMPPYDNSSIQLRGFKRSGGIEFDIYNEESMEEMAQEVVSVVQLMHHQCQEVRKQKRRKKLMISALLFGVLCFFLLPHIIY